MRKSDFLQNFTKMKKTPIMERLKCSKRPPIRSLKKRYSFANVKKRLKALNLKKFDKSNSVNDKADSMKNKKLKKIENEKNLIEILSLIGDLKMNLENEQLYNCKQDKVLSKIIDENLELEKKLLVSSLKQLNYFCQRKLKSFFEVLKI